MTHMVDIAQSVEQLIVVQQVARSSRVIHPSKARFGGAFVIALSGSGHDTQAGALSGVLVS